jgi:hypothetical protein
VKRRRNYSENFSSGTKKSYNSRRYEGAEKKQYQSVEWWEGKNISTHLKFSLLNQ